MDLKQGASTRRRGDELEKAILDAAWQQLVEAGYSAFTYEAIAARAGTSRPVLYRRWPTREDLLVAAMRHATALTPVPTPDTGSLRDDAVKLLSDFNAARSGFAALISVRAGEYFSATGTTFAELRSLLLQGRSGTAFGVIIDQAAARGELDRTTIPDRVMELPVDLMRHEMMMNMASVSEEDIAAIVDDIWLPLLRTYGARV